MKWGTTILIAVVITTLAFCQTNSTVVNKTIAQTQRKSFVVLELFTSEGCSSCPSADRLLPEFMKIDSNVIPLSFHVDYWDNLGWKDAFSNASYTERQKHYAEQLHLESIYTPQLIINGQYEMVGSDRQKAEGFIKKVQEEKPVAEIKIGSVKEEKQQLDISCRLEGNFKNSNLIAALVQKRAERKIGAGENKGALLTHTNVVRSFAENNTAPEMYFKMEIPPDLKDGEWKLILYTQTKTDLKITGATFY
jgi:hypothetical protein